MFPNQRASVREALRNANQRNAADFTAPGGNNRWTFTDPITERVFTPVYIQRSLRYPIPPNNPAAAVRPPHNIFAKMRYRLEPSIETDEFRPDPTIDDEKERKESQETFIQLFLDQITEFVKFVIKNELLVRGDAINYLRRRAGDFAPGSYSSYIRVICESTQTGQSMFTPDYEPVDGTNQWSVALGDLIKERVVDGGSDWTGEPVDEIIIEYYRQTPGYLQDNLPLGPNVHARHRLWDENTDPRPIGATGRPRQGRRQQQPRAGDVRRSARIAGARAQGSVFRQRRNRRRSNRRVGRGTNPFFDDEALHGSDDDEDEPEDPEEEETLDGFIAPETGPENVEPAPRLAEDDEDEDVSRIVEGLRERSLQYQEELERELQDEAMNNFDVEPLSDDEEEDDDLVDMVDGPAPPPPEPAPAEIVEGWQEWRNEKENPPLSRMPDLHNNMCGWYSLEHSYVWTAAGKDYKKYTKEQARNKTRQTRNWSHKLEKDENAWKKIRRGAACTRLNTSLKPALDACGVSLKNTPVEGGMALLASDGMDVDKHLEPMAAYYTERLGQPVGIDCIVVNGLGRTSSRVQTKALRRNEVNMTLHIVLDQVKEHYYPTFNPELLWTRLHKGVPEEMATKVYLCESCSTWVFRNSTNLHICDGACTSCGMPGVQHPPPTDMDDLTIVCTDCYKYFGSQECLDAHKIRHGPKGNRGSVCQTTFCCPNGYDPFDCKVNLDNRCTKNPIRRRQNFSRNWVRQSWMFQTPEEHDCAKPFACQNCKEYVAPDHGCLMTSDTMIAKPNEDDPEPFAIFYDMEATQEDTIVAYGENADKEEKDAAEEGELLSRVHVANLIASVGEGGRGDVALMNPTAEEANDIEGNKYTVVHSTVREWLDNFVLQPNKNGAVFVAHNGSRYDSLMVLKEMFTNAERYKKYHIPGNSLIHRGSSVLCFEIRNKRPGKGVGSRKFKNWCVKFIDSFLFMEAPLSKLPKMFGIENTAKGDFPHLFNTKDMPEELPAGQIPTWETFITSGWSHQRRLEMAVWYNQKKQKYAEQNLVFKAKEELVEYCINDTHVLCLAFQEFRRSMRELFRKIKETNPDASERLLELDPINFKTKASMCQAVHAMMIPDGVYRDPAGPYQRMVRSAVAGGYTEVFKNYVNTTELNVAEGIGTADDYTDDCTNPGEMELRSKGNRMYKGDFVSLYPHVMRSFPFPKGRPSLWKDPEEQDVNKWLEKETGMRLICGDFEEREGINKKDNHPPLWQRHEDKTLIYCWGNRKHKWYPDVEVKEALGMYKCTKIHAVLEWPEASTEIFAPYIKSFLTLKHLASGWPKADMTEEEKDVFVAKLLEEDGVELDKSQVEFNAGLRASVKIMLNCLWGKYFQKPSYEQSSNLVVNHNDETSMQRLFKLMYEKRITGIIPLSIDTTVVRYHNRSPDHDKVVELEEEAAVYNYCDPAYEKLVETNPETGHIIPPTRDIYKYVQWAPTLTVPCYDKKGQQIFGCYTTAYARTKCLRQAIQKVGNRRMVYCDTDSVLFLCKPGEEPEDFFKLSGKLGGMTNDLVDKGEDEESFKGLFCSEFVGLAPKCYSQTVMRGPLDYKKAVHKYEQMRLSREDLLQVATDPAEADYAQRVLKGELTDAEVEAIKTTDDFREWGVMGACSKLRVKGVQMNNVLVNYKVNTQSIKDLVMETEEEIKVEHDSLERPLPYTLATKKITKSISIHPTPKRKRDQITPGMMSTVPYDSMDEYREEKKRRKMLY